MEIIYELGYTSDKKDVRYCKAIIKTTYQSSPTMVMYIQHEGVGDDAAKQKVKEMLHSFGLELVQKTT